MNRGGRRPRRILVSAPVPEMRLVRVYELVIVQQQVRIR